MYLTGPSQKKASATQSRHKSLEQGSHRLSVVLQYCAVPTLILIGRALALLALGIVTRVRIFILSSAALVVVGTLRALFLATPPSLALMLLGGILLAIATALFLARRQLRTAWNKWE